MTFKIRGHTFHPLNLAMCVAAAAWIWFQFFVPIESRPPVLNESFLLVLGAWVTSKSIEQNKIDQRRDQQMAQTRSKVELLQQNADISMTSETSRVTAEEDRVTAEAGRVDAESRRPDARVTAEEDRVTAEEGRVTAEAERVEENRKPIVEKEQEK